MCSVQWSTTLVPITKKRLMVSSSSTSVYASTLTGDGNLYEEERTKVSARQPFCNAFAACALPSLILQLFRAAT